MSHLTTEQSSSHNTSRQHPGKRPGKRWRAINTLRLCGAVVLPVDCLHCSLVCIYIPLSCTLGVVRVPYVRDSSQCIAVAHDSAVNAAPQGQANSNNAFVPWVTTFACCRHDSMKCCQSSRRDMTTTWNPTHQKVIFGLCRQWPQAPWAGTQVNSESSCTQLCKLFTGSLGLCKSCRPRKHGHTLAISTCHPGLNINNQVANCCALLTCMTVPQSSSALSSCFIPAAGVGVCEHTLAV